MRILMLGDTHGNIAWIRHAVEKAVITRCEVIVQLGDFGYWPHMPKGKIFLEKTSAIVSEAGLRLYWVDGNHENHDAITELVVTEAIVRGSADFASNPFIEHEPNVFYCPRGFAWNWDGFKFLALGGAFSIDKAYRIPGVSWWESELTTQADIDRAKAHGKVDVMLCHDVPRGVTPWDEFTERDRAIGRWPQSAANRDRIREACDAVMPKVLFHGHYHERHEEMITIGNPPQAMSVQGLGCDGDSVGSTYVFDTEDFRRTA